jgi:hypothetical protein
VLTRGSALHQAYCGWQGRPLSSQCSGRLPCSCQAPPWQHSCTGTSSKQWVRCRLTPRCNPDLSVTCHCWTSWSNCSLSFSNHDASSACESLGASVLFVRRCRVPHRYGGSCMQHVGTQGATHWQCCTSNSPCLTCRLQCVEGTG